MSFERDWHWARAAKAWRHALFGMITLLHAPAWISVMGGVVVMELLDAEGGQHGVEDAELAGGDRANHDATGEEALRAQFDETHLRCDTAHAHEHGALAASTALVHLGEERVRRVRDDGGDNAGNDTAGERNAELSASGDLLCPYDIVDAFLCRVLHHKLSDGVWDLLEEDGDEAGVETSDQPLLGHDSRGCAWQRELRHVGVGDLLDACRLKRAEEDVGDELSACGGNGVEHEAVVPRALVAVRLGEVHLEELETAELEPPLHKVTEGSRRHAGGKRHGTLGLDDVGEGAAHAHRTQRRVELHARLDDVDRARRAVGH
eukprot:CAMPEP_0174754278 /NCGR_PEP_ID=MMETSP1094-20130205/105651_1 /TAXON_ID=156173 /ORGANISM="Chrysochromulina brevifilum, Strain UTEX LB 985" /LENGTH=318 /DNA_ID=CAMNT_0015960141 /DNA_START=814 /DNA_END=1771 /DNA_ORIENTATION=+